MKMRGAPCVRQQQLPRFLPRPIPGSRMNRKQKAVAAATALHKVSEVEAQSELPRAISTLSLGQGGIQYPEGAGVANV
jgi:hypothetical protein